MLSREEYIKRVTVLGQYLSPERGKATALLIFSCLKGTLSAEEAQSIYELLPEPVRYLWKEAPSNGRSGNTDCVALAKKVGNYPYRAAAERAFEVVFASIGEIIDDNTKDKLIGRLPSQLKVIFERSRTCALDGSVGDFL